MRNWDTAELTLLPCFTSSILSANSKLETQNSKLPLMYNIKVEARSVSKRKLLRGWKRRGKVQTCQLAHPHSGLKVPALGCRLSRNS